MPAAIIAGKTVEVTVIMKNCRSFDNCANLSDLKTWDANAACKWKLGRVNPKFDNTWRISRASLPPGAIVPPGSEAEFKFNITAPSTGGSYSFQWQMFQEANPLSCPDIAFDQWFGDVTPVKNIWVFE